MTRRTALMGTLASLAASAQPSAGAKKAKMFPTFPVDPAAAQKLRSQVAAPAIGATKPDPAKENHLLAVLLLCGDPNNFSLIADKDPSKNTPPQDSAFKNTDPDAYKLVRSQLLASSDLQSNVPLALGHFMNCYRQVADNYTNTAYPPGDPCPLTAVDGTLAALLK